MNLIDESGKPVSIFGSAMSFASGRVQEVIESFARCGLNTVEVVFSPNEYASLSSARGSVAQAVASTGCPAKVSVKRGHLYLKKKF